MTVSYPSVESDAVSAPAEVLCFGGVRFARPIGADSVRPVSGHAAGENAPHVWLWGYPLLLSPAEAEILVCLLRSVEGCAAGETHYLPAGDFHYPAAEVGVLVHRINQKAARISGRRLILSRGHSGYRLNPFH